MNFPHVEQSNHIQGSHYILPKTTFFLLPQIKQRELKKVNMIIKLFTLYISFQRLLYKSSQILMQKNNNTSFSLRFFPLLTFQWHLTTSYVFPIYKNNITFHRRRYVLYCFPNALKQSNIEGYNGLKLLWMFQDKIEP